MKLTKRKAVGIILLTVLLLVGVGVWWFAEPRPDVTRGAYERIQMGMTLEEVEGIIGGKPGAYINPYYRWTGCKFGEWEGDIRPDSVGFTQEGKGFLVYKERQEVVETRYWITERSSITCGFSIEGAVVTKQRDEHDCYWDWRLLLPEWLRVWLP
jgi:hypothetical protein